MDDTQGEGASNRSALLVLLTWKVLPGTDCVGDPGGYFARKKVSLALTGWGLGGGEDVCKCAKSFKPVSKISRCTCHSALRT